MPPKPDDAARVPPDDTPAVTGADAPVPDDTATVVPGDTATVVPDDTAPVPAFVPPAPGQIVHREELARGDYLLEAVALEGGEALWVASFALDTPEAQRGFSTYLDDLAALRPAQLLGHDPAGRVYWAPAALERPEDLVERGDAETLRPLAERLAPAGYALIDAELVRSEDGGLRLGYLHPAARSGAEVAHINAALLPPPEAAPLPGPGVLGWLPGALLLAGALYFGSQAANTYLNPPLGSVPGVTGQSGQAAADAVAAAGYRVEVVEGEAPGRPVGSVIGQQPQGGAALPLGRQVVITVNEPPDLTAPDLSDLTLAQARTALAENQLQLGETLNVDGTLTGTGAGRVVGQLPAPGMLTARGQDVRLLVSTGVREENTWLPDLSGLGFEHARAYARSAGLIVSRVQTRTSELPEGTVLEQSPAPYADVAVGSPVTLTVARSAELFVPSAPLLPPDAGRDAALPRTVTLDYTFADELPVGLVELWVRDADGERPLMAPTSTAQLVGQRASAPVPVRGEAEFLVLLDGVVYETFFPLEAP